MAETGNEVKQNIQANSASNEPKERKSIVTSFSQTKSELKKVHWPKPEELKKYTAVVVFVVAFFSVAIYLIDSALGYAISLLVK